MSRTDVWLYFAPPLLWLMLDRLSLGILDDHLLSMRVISAAAVVPGIIAEASSGFWKTLAIEVLIWFVICLFIAWLAGRWSIKTLSRKHLAVGTCLVWCLVLLPSVLDWENGTQETDSLIK